MNCSTADHLRHGQNSSVLALSVAVSRKKESFGVDELAKINRYNLQLGRAGLLSAHRKAPAPVN
jgi:hypothetical protein